MKEQVGPTHLQGVAKKLVGECIFLLNMGVRGTLPDFGPNFRTTADLATSV